MAHNLVVEWTLNSKLGVKVTQEKNEIRPSPFCRIRGTEFIIECANKSWEFLRFVCRISVRVNYDQVALGVRNCRGGRNVTMGMML